MSTSNGSYTGKRRKGDGPADGDLAGWLAELDAARALAGVRAIAAERVRQVRDGSVGDEGDPYLLIVGAVELEDYARAGALCAAQIDRDEAP